MLRAVLKGMALAEAAALVFAIAMPAFFGEAAGLRDFVQAVAECLLWMVLPAQPVIVVAGVAMGIVALRLLHHRRQALVALALVAYPVAVVVASAITQRFEYLERMLWVCAPFAIPPAIAAALLAEHWLRPAPK